MAQPRDEKTILVIDDEPHNQSWMQDFIEDLGYSAKLCINLNEAIEAIDGRNYRAAIIDLNIPALEPMDLEVRKKGDVYARFPGLFAARYARDKGYRNRQVIVYSVFQDVDVQKEVALLNCTYVIKGRPKAFKDELEDVLSFDPSAAR